MSDYNYTGFAAESYNLDAPECPKVGQKAPDFEAHTTTGKPRRLLDFEGAFLVLEMGSITCPLFQGRRDTMAKTVAANSDISFAVLYTREAHPGANIAAHKTLKDKQKCAAILKGDDQEGRVVLVDGLEGNAHRAYGGFPNSIFIINRKGCIVFQSDWNNPRATARALRLLKSGKPAPAQSYFLPAKPTIVFKTLNRAGGGSKSEFFQHLPKLIWKNIIKRNFRLFLGRSPATTPDGGC